MRVKERRALHYSQTFTLGEKAGKKEVSLAFAPALLFLVSQIDLFPQAYIAVINLEYN